MKYVNTTCAAYGNIHANQACTKFVVFHCQHQLYSIEDLQTEKANALQLQGRWGWLVNPRAFKATLAIACAQIYALQP